VTPPLSTRLLATLLLAALASTLAGCGRKGPLEAEPHAPTASLPSSDEEPPEGQAPKPQPGQPRPFLLDPML
jgi:predicted small lipoprotein YifL